MPKGRTDGNYEFRNKRFFFPQDKQALVLENKQNNMTIDPSKIFKESGQPALISCRMILVYVTEILGLMCTQVKLTCNLENGNFL